MEPRRARPFLTMKDQIEKVKTFHRLTENDWRETPGVPGEDRLALRTNLIIEEAREFEEAAKKGDLVEMADALTDLLYVTYGSLGELGLANIADHLFDEVQASNMSKVCKTKEEAELTVAWYKDQKKTGQCEAEFRAVPGGFLVERVSDGKILKSKNYSPVNLVDIIAQDIPE